MPNCTGSITDQWRTVWRCELERHTGGLCRRGVIQWITPGIGDGLRLRNVPVDSYQWTGSDPGAAPEWLDVESTDDLFHALRILVATPTGVQPRHVLPREWAVLWSDGRVSTYRPDDYDVLFEDGS